MIGSPNVPGSNVLVIQADQFRADCMGVAGNRDVDTPNLDRLASDGIRYRNAFCPLPVCTPSRYSMLSGRYVHQHGGWTNHSTMAPGIDTFAKALRRAGYRTAAVGKMHFTPTRLDLGYDRMELAEQNGPGRYEDDYHHELMAAGLVPAVDLVDQESEFRARAPRSYWESYGTGPSDLPEEWHSTTWIGERALGVLEGWSETGGELMHVSFVKPHHPFDPPRSWRSMYDADELTPLPGWTETIPAGDLAYRRGYFDYDDLSLPVLREAMAGYYATISQLDHYIGRMVEVLRRRGLYDDTLIVFTSDHGEYLGFHHLLLKGGPMYDPLVKVPLLLKLPSSASGPGGDSGRVDDALVSLVDVAPTILAACGAETSDPLPGLDLADPTAARDVVVVEDRSPIAYMVRTRTHKLLLHEIPERDALFDLAEDPHEFDNRIGDPAMAGVVRDLRDALARWLMFETPAPRHLDVSAPEVDRPDAPDRSPDRLRAFFRDRLSTTVTTEQPRA